MLCFVHILFSSLVEFYLRGDPIVVRSLGRKGLVRISERQSIIEGGSMERDELDVVALVVEEAEVRGNCSITKVGRALLTIVKGEVFVRASLAPVVTENPSISAPISIDRLGNPAADLTAGKRIVFRGVLVSFHD